jgi:hypothetical protein
MGKGYLPKPIKEISDEIFENELFKYCLSSMQGNKFIK